MAIGMKMVWACLIVGRVATPQPVTVGQPAPKWMIGAVVQGHVEEPGLKPTVVEFWATWCPPCREAIPHLNELADQFTDRSINFLSVTHESDSEDKVRAFLKTHPMRGTVALDREGKTFQVYGAGLPTTVLITASGKIAGATNEPERITPAMLEDLLAERPIDLPAMSSLGPRRPLSFGMKIIEPAALVRIVITPVVSGEPGFVARGDQFESRGTTVSELLAFAYDISPTRIIVPTPLQQRAYAVQAWVPPSRVDLLKPLMQTAIAAAAGFQTKRETRRVDVLILHGLPGKLRESYGSPHPSMKVEPGHLSGDGIELDWLQKQIEAEAAKPVIIDHPINKQVQYDVRWDPSKPDSFETALRDQLGVEVKRDLRDIEFLVIEDRENRKP